MNNIISIEELLTHEIQETSNDLNEHLRGCYFDHIPEFCLSAKLKNPKKPKIIIKVYKECYYDERRFWRLSLVEYKRAPVMIIQNAGREGDDHYKRFIINLPLYKEMIIYLYTIVDFDQYFDIDKEESFKQVDTKKPFAELTEFRGGDLFGAFEKSDW